MHSTRKMTLNIDLVLVLMLLPTVLSLPTVTDRPAIRTGINPQCELDLHVHTSNEIGGLFELDDNLEIRFRAVLENNAIYSTSSVVSLSDPDTSLIVQLSFSNTEGRVVPGIEKHVVETAGRLAESTACHIPEHLNNGFEELADRLYRCTESMGMSQLRFSIMYHETIVASAKRICNGAETVCTASPKYIYGNELFICEEDIEELFPERMEEARRKMAEIKKPKEATEELTEARGKRKSWWCWVPPCWGLEGGDYGCCGNYEGCCWFCSPACLAHDLICQCCLDGSWFCGPACKKDSGCGK